MSSKNFKGSLFYLQRMQEACRKIREYTENTTEAEFLSRKKSYDAICLQFAQLGEQVAHLEKSPERVIQHFPDDLKWSALKAIRNIISHNYTAIDAQMIWKFAKENIAETEIQLGRILKKRFGV